MKKLRLLLLPGILFCLMANIVNAQPIKKGSRSIHIGPALSHLMGGGGETSLGAAFNAEVGYGVSRSIGVRLYLGGMYTGNVSDEERYTNGRFGSDARFFNCGLKLRIAFPFKKVAPFFSVGVGQTFGTLRSEYIRDSYDQTGSSTHGIGVFGISVGKKRRYEFLVTNFFHYSTFIYLNRIDHGFMMGISVPIE